MAPSSSTRHQKSVFSTTKQRVLACSPKGHARSEPCCLECKRNATGTHLKDKGVHVLFRVCEGAGGDAFVAHLNGLGGVALGAGQLCSRGGTLKGRRRLGGAKGRPCLQSSMHGQSGFEPWGQGKRQVHQGSDARTYGWRSGLQLLLLEQMLDVAGHRLPCKLILRAGLHKRHAVQPAGLDNLH